jgi:hypothetical protein
MYSDLRQVQRFHCGLSFLGHSGECRVNGVTVKVASLEVVMSEPFQSGSLVRSSGKNMINEFSSFSAVFVFSMSTY